MQLTEHFTLEELVNSVTAKNKGINNTPDDIVKSNLEALAITVLEPLRIEFKEPIKVSSGYRCPKLNASIGGVKNSQHLLGQAADITTLSDTPESNQRLFDVAVRLIKIGKIDVGQCIDEYHYSWIHISTPYIHTNQILHIK